MEAGEGPSLRGLEPGTDGAVLAVVQPSPSSSTATPSLATRQNRRRPSSENPPSRARLCAFWIEGVKAVCDALALGRSSVFGVCSAPLDLVTVTRLSWLHQGQAEQQASAIIGALFGYA
ncbi:hypothetical protein FQA47_001126 [Oryzias melastigma]|uniref:Uncharacterized protein n=1 Tax=Oryzias melastigma TaxID=30732 RepID=A0A834C447_ORYME|nr:hypothetical protein FQA47_001126 [Oryzias melastigma]